MSTDIPIDRTTVTSYFKDSSLNKAKKNKPAERPPAAPRGMVPCPNCADLGEVDLQCVVCHGDGAVSATAE